MKKSALLLAGLAVAAFAGAPSLAGVPTSAEKVSPIMVGQTIPSATVVKPDGSEADVAKLIGSKPAVVIFYRGGW